MKPFFSILKIGSAILLSMVGIYFLPQVPPAQYEVFFILALLAVASLFIYLTRSQKNQYRIADFGQAIWLFTLSWVSIHFLGGIPIRLNIVIALIAAALIGTYAHPLHSVYIIFLTLAASLVALTNGLYGYIPGSSPTNIQNIPSYVFSIFFPIVSVILFQVV